MTTNSETAPGEDRSTALAFVNSKHRRGRVVVDQIETPELLHAWLSRHSMTVPEPPITARELERTHALRDAIRTLMHGSVEGEHPPREMLRIVNEAASAAPRAAALDWTASRGPTRRYTTVKVSPIELVLSAMATDAIELLTDERRQELVECSGPGCIRFLLKDHPRRHWCSPGCGERARAARYYRRHLPQPGGAQSSALASDPSNAVPRGG